MLAKNLLTNVADETDKYFPTNQCLRIEKGEPTLSRLKKKTEPQNLKLIKSMIAERLEQVSILDILFISQQWYNLTKFFGPLSGFDAKIMDPIERYLIALFCYGCNLGPSQTSNSLDILSRKQVAYIDKWHINEDKLDKVITHIINLYNQFSLIKYWGTGERGAADGTMWDLYENNLFSENHIRYGGYGGLGYYVVSDLYIALFSRFIPCGVWEGIYILDVLMNEHSKIKPNILHSDTQGQNEPIFGLAFLLGIDLMPRIRNWKHLKFYKADKNVAYKHINELFSDDINWNIIKMHLPDMLRVALSIKTGRITPSTILRKLGSYSRKNKLYQAFSELGKVLRTKFLLKYISDVNLQRTIQIATNKNEAYNGFTKWIGFGGEGVISENNRNAQMKFIKYNHLVANCVIFYNVYHMSIILQNLISEGYEITEEILASLSPYITGHINRFGKYGIDKNRKIPNLKFDIKLL
jgi:TnpA family transposase